MTDYQAPDDDAPPGDETRAFQSFYLAGEPSGRPDRSGLLQRLLRWWRRR
ncbi:MAG TPA: hypothetical protein VKV25_09180 [Acidimicrobiales bacterium]|nr:hypothetical protein [Acidimicrobiales bacterium]